MTETVKSPGAAPADAARASSILKQSMCCDMHACMPLRPGDDEFLPQLERYRAAGVKFVSLNVGWDASSIEQHVAMLAHFRSWLRRHPERYALVSDVASIEAAAASGRLAVAFDIEGMNAIGDRLAMIDLYYDLGVRWMLLAYNRNNAVGGGCQDADTGLTAFGRAVVEAMARTGMILCCSHAGERTALEAIDLSENPVIFSHSNASAVFEHHRNIGDSVIKACAGRGGLIGINGIGMFLGENDATAAIFVRHIDHVVQLVGPEHVGIGLDYVFDGAELDEMIAQFPEIYPPAQYRCGIRQIAPEQLPDIVLGLLRLGYSEAAIGSILGGNFLRVARAVWV